MPKTQIPDSAREVLDHFGLDENDYEKLDPCVDWESVARSLENPTKVAACHILDKNGDVVVFPTGPVLVYEETPVENAQEELEKKSLRFVEWW